MAWQGEGLKRQIAARAVFLPVERKRRVLWYLGPERRNRSLAGLTDGFTAALERQGTSVWLPPCFDKQSSEIKSRLMIAENLAGGGSVKACPCPTGHRDRTALRTNRNMAGR